MFVREWAHLRYGVFDEYGQAKDRNYPLFYRPQGSSSAIVPNLCTNKPPIFTVRYVLRWDAETSGAVELNF